MDNLATHKEKALIETFGEKRGKEIWSMITPHYFRHGSGMNLEHPAQALPSGALPIIGNKNSRIYHLPNCDSYQKVSPKNRVIFRSEKDAQAAGYRVAKNCS